MENLDLLNYVRDSLRLMIEKAIEAKQISKSARNEKNATESAFEEGRALAYYEVITMLLSEAEVFGLSTDQLPELDFNADKELLS